MGQPSTHPYDDGPHRHDTVRSGEAFGRGATPRFTDDADETMPLIPPVVDNSADNSGIDRTLEPPKRTGQASVCQAG
jgi:hypothetical protein